MKKKKVSRMKRKNCFLKEQDFFYEDCDDTFAFIAGYTDGGAPYGVQWWELGIDPMLPFEEKVRIYQSGEYETKRPGVSECSEEDTDEFEDLPFN